MFNAGEFEVEALVTERKSFVIDAHRVQCRGVHVNFVIFTCMLISLWAGRKPMLQTHEIIC